MTTIAHAKHEIESIHIPNPEVFRELATHLQNWASQHQEFLQLLDTGHTTLKDAWEGDGSHAYTLLHTRSQEIGNTHLEHFQRASEALIKTSNLVEEADEKKSNAWKWILGIAVLAVIVAVALAGLPAVIAGIIKTLELAINFFSSAFAALLGLLPKGLPSPWWLLPFITSGGLGPIILSGGGSGGTIPVPFPGLDPGAGGSGGNGGFFGGGADGSGFGIDGSGDSGGTGGGGSGGAPPPPPDPPPPVPLPPNDRQDMLHQLAARVQQIRQQNPGISAERNIAVADYSVYDENDHEDSSGRLQAVSGENPPSIFVQPPLSPLLHPPGTTDNSREFDSEYLILERIAARYWYGNPEQRASIHGDIWLYTELAPCQSCLQVIEQFHQAFPNLTIHIGWG